MAKEISLTEIRDLVMQVCFNYKKESGKYVPCMIFFSGKATGENVLVVVDETLSIGEERDKSYSPKEIYSFVKQKLGQEIADKIKNIYLTGINEDISS